VQWVVAQIDLAQNPEEVLTDLAHGEGDAAERVFDRSYKLPQLDDGGRALLLALSLFTPSAARPALAAVAGMDLAKTRDKKRFKRAQETLASLWLLERVSGGLRLTVRGLTRELTRNRLSRDLRSKTFNQRYVARFSRFAASHNSQVPHEHDVLEVEKDNLLNAVAMAAEMHDPVTTLKLMTSIAFPGMLDMRGYWDDAIKYGKLALQAARDLGDTSLGGALTHGIGTILESKGDYSAAKEYYREAEEAARLMKNMDGLAATLYQTASLNLELGDLPAANRLSTEALELAKTNQDEDGVAKALLILARIACEQDDLQKASSLIDQSKEIARRLADDGITAGVYYQLAHIASIQRDFQRAEELYKRSLELSQKRGDKDYIAINLHALGVLATERDDHNEAKRYFTESLEISSQLGKRPGVAHCLTGLGVLHAKTGSPDAAERFFLEALTIFQEIDSSLADDIRRRLEALRRLKK
jgi:tetratricopeptide (TPR) repeat protein